MGHRCYTKEDVALFHRIRKWKEQGLQLKAIRLMLSEDGKLSVPQEVVRQAQAMVEKEGARDAAGAEETALLAGEGTAQILLDERESKAARLQYLLESLVSRAVQENNERILKEIDYQFRQLEENAQAREQRQWEREEEHYRKLDELLCQKGRRKDKRKKHSKF